MARRPPRLLPALLCALAALTGAAEARADGPIATTARPLTMAADGGVVAWPQHQRGGGYRFVVAGPGRAPRAIGPHLDRQPPFDVARERGGTPVVVVWTENCSLRRHRCDVRTLSTRTGRSRRLTRIPYAGGGPPAVAQHGHRIAYAVAAFRGSPRTRVQCDTPYTRRLTGTSHPDRPRRLDRGSCAEIDALDVDRRYVALLVEPRGGETRPTEARVIPVTGGRSRTLQDEGQSEEPNFIDAVTLDGGDVYTARDGVRRLNVFTRIDPRTGRTTEARAFTALGGGFARDHGHQYYVQNTRGEVGDTCPDAAGTPCRVVAGTDPFAGAPRTLAPVVTLSASPDIVYADAPLTLSGTLTQRRVSRTAVLDTVPVTGTPVTLQTAQEKVKGPSLFAPFAPAGPTATTDGAGHWTIVLGPPHPPGTGYLATAGAPGAVGVASVSPAAPQIWVRLAISSATRSGAGIVTLSGTIDPPQPGRPIRIDRRTKRECVHAVFPRPQPAPSTLDTPKGCDDEFTGLDAGATTQVSADGRAFTVSRPGPAGGSYRALLLPDPAAVYAGETAQVTVP